MIETIQYYMINFIVYFTVFFVVLFTLLYLYGNLLPIFVKTWLRENFDINLEDEYHNNTFNNTFNNTIEKFTENKNNIGKLASYPIVEFDTYQYLNRDTNSPEGSIIIKRNTQELPVLSMTIYQQPIKSLNNTNNADNGNSTNDIGTYLEAVYKYMRKHIYPVKAYISSSSIDTINKLISGDIDIAFVNEEILTRYIKQDCKYLSNLIKYNPINFSAIGIGYYQDFYLIVPESSNILQPVDLLQGSPKILGIWYDSIYSFIKLFTLYGFNISITTNTTNNTTTNISDIQLNLIDNNVLTIKVFTNVPEMFKEFRDNKLNSIFLIEHPKNKPLENLAKNTRIRLIHLQPHITFSTYTNRNTSQDDKNKRAKIEEIGVKNKYNLNKEDFNGLVRKTFQWIFPRVIDLNKFKLPTLNTYTYLETYSTRMILVARDNIKPDIISYLANNYITGLEKMRTNIDRTLYTYKLANYSVNDFQWDELVSFDNKIPLHNSARNIYIKEGLLKINEKK